MSDCELVTEGRLTLAAPAKINLWLRIFGRRPDGFHDLETRMLALELADEVTLEHLPQGAPGTVVFSCSDPSLPVDDSNLARRAVTLLAEQQGRPLPAVRVHLEKRIPHGAGLGGGSSDAAAVLRGLNDLLQLGLSLETLSHLAARLGSDVPFFLIGGAADCTGWGEIVTPVSGFTPRCPVLLVKPPFPVPTPWAYQQWQASQEIPGVDYGPQRIRLAEGNTVEVVNHLERPVFAKYLLLADLKTWLRGRPEVAAALLSGSGATVFALLREGALVEALRSEIRAEFGPQMWTWAGRSA